MGRYLARAAWEEAKILARRRPIAELIAQPGVDSGTRSKLVLVLEAREFASDSVQLHTRRSFTTFSRLDRDTLVLVLSGAWRDRLVRKTWWFPVVGRVPYKGYFDFDAARAALRELDREGFDAYLRPAAAFSTLGWFNDPLLPTTLREDSIDLANTVIHELTHNTLYARGRAVFNESFANFVGARGSEWFFRSRGQDTVASEVAARWEDEKRLGRFWMALYAEIDSAFRANPDDRAARLAARHTLYAAARDRLLHDVAPRLRTISPRALEHLRLDNAALMGRRVYMTDLDLFDQIWEREKRDLPRVIELVRRLYEKCRDPFDALKYYAISGDLPERDPGRERCEAARASWLAVTATSGESPAQQLAQIE